MTDEQIRRAIRFTKEEIVRARNRIEWHEMLVNRAFCEIAEYQRILEERNASPQVH